jgi:hypothetical protein
LFFQQLDTSDVECVFGKMTESSHAFTGMWIETMNMSMNLCFGGRALPGAWILAIDDFFVQ